MAINKIRSINGKAIEDYELKQNVLTKDNNTEYTPTGNYNPSTKKYVDEKVAGIVDSAPETLDTLKELSAALGNDANFAATVSTQIGNKVDKVDGKGLSTNDLTNELKTNYDAAYTHSTSAHAPSDAQKNSDITKAEIEAKLTGTITSHNHEEATSTNAGFMSADDKTKLMGISPGANNYSHPNTHPASMITGLSTVATSGSYNDLNNKPSIPTVTNDLTNELKTNYDAAYTHSTSVHAPSNAQKNSDITKAEIEAKLTGDITSHTHSQYLTSIPAEYITEAELNAKGYAPLDSPNFTNSISMARKSDTTIGAQSVALGYNTTASGFASHAEGNLTTASGDISHAEGTNTIASGEASHAEGGNTTASGAGSHAEGGGTIASSENQHVQGKYNIEDTERKYAHIVGNGTSDTARSNAHTLDWDGNAWFAGKVAVGTAPTANMDVATKQYVDDTVAANAGSGTGSTADYRPYSIRYNSSNDRLEFIYTPHTTERISLSWTANTNVSNSGIITSDNLAMVTDFIAKEDGYKYLLYLDNTASTKISFWDSSKTFISRSNDYTVLGTDVEIEFPEGTVYFRVKTDAIDPVTIDNVNEHVIVKKVSI